MSLTELPYYPVRNCYYEKVIPGPFNFLGWDALGYLYRELGDPACAEREIYNEPGFGALHEDILYLRTLHDSGNYEYCFGKLLWFLEKHWAILSKLYPLTRIIDVYCQIKFWIKSHQQWRHYEKVHTNQ